MTESRQSPLRDEHVALGARLVPFSGWEMPLRYHNGTVTEHLTTRESAGLFDVSHLGSIAVSGADAASCLNRLFTNDLNRISPGRAQYTLLVNESGGVVDDIIVWWLEPELLWVIPNAANAKTVADAIVTTCDAANISDRSEEMAIIALQGPLWQQVMENAGLGDVVPGRFRVVSSETLIAAGTGYTGEPGCELLVPADEAVEVWRRLLTACESFGGCAAGLGARDTLRLEMGYPLHGNEMDAEVTPWESGLDWVVDLEKGDFHGREVLDERVSAARWMLIGFEMLGREIPRTHCRVDLSGGESGIVTSGNYSPVLGHGIGLARVPPRALSAGDPLTVDIRGRKGRAVCVVPPFVDR